ncbi:hypothetical protein [Streptomyces sp. MBT62]|uniref:hypothetical protein n=1 Tax=Streptomyces sp. MBT62 TaxID=2800410 RepID=UPI00190BE3A9|nr:hypothetical protein [Streptomyces sp. MBT62]MBK3568550.1 hypothetical protein [Streptomyces sp. MBT62]
MISRRRRGPWKPPRRLPPSSPLAWPGPAAALVLCAAAVAQVGDAVVGIAARKSTTIAGASLLTAIHLATTVATA